MKTIGLKTIGSVMLVAILMPPFLIPNVAQTRRKQTRSRRARAAAPAKPGVRSARVAATTHVIKVKPNGVFDPQDITINAGDTIKWTQLGRRDAVVQIANPGTSLAVCGVNKNFPHAFDSSDKNEFTGPTRLGVSGIFALGPNGPGFKEINRNDPGRWRCQCGSGEADCGFQFTRFADFKLCPEEGIAYDFLPETWANPDITGVTIRLNWSDIQKDINQQIVYVWDDLDRQMEKAVQHGKLFTLDVRAGSHGTPPWIFTTYSGRNVAPPGPVTPIVLKDWLDGPEPPGTCGFEMTLGSPTDEHYRDLYVAMIRELARHVASDSRWFQALAYVKASGANFITSEARLPKHCFDGDDANTKLDDNCVCNTQRWAEAGYTPEGLYRYYRVVENAIYEAFFRRKSINYQLIQDGFPRVTSATNFQGDSLNNHNGRPLVQPRGTDDDDLGVSTQTEEILRQGRRGVFVIPFADPLTIITDSTHRSEGFMFVPQHSGLQRLPDDLSRISSAYSTRISALWAIEPVSLCLRM